MMHSGRPKLRAPLVEELFFGRAAEYYIIKATYLVDLVACLVYSAGMRLSEALEQIVQQLTNQAERTKKIRDEMEELRPSYTKFLDLQRELKERQNRMRRIIAVLGPKMFDITKSDDYFVENEWDCPHDDPEELRENLSLWQAVETFVSINGPSRVGEIQEFLDSVDIDSVSRQAIESAVNRHPEVFKTISKNRERYITLRG
jgi:hypothetical protein